MDSSLAHAPPLPKCRQNWLSSSCEIRLTNKQTNVVENVTCLARVIMWSVARFLCNGQTSRFCRRVDGLRPGNRYLVSSGFRFCVFTCSILCLTCPASASGPNNCRRAIYYIALNQYIATSLPSRCNTVCRCSLQCSYNAVLQGRPLSGTRHGLSAGVLGSRTY